MTPRECGSEGHHGARGAVERQFVMFADTTSAIQPPALLRRKCGSSGDLETSVREKHECLKSRGMRLRR